MQKLTIIISDRGIKINTPIESPEWVDKKCVH
jgi:hypothetical protein